MARSNRRELEIQFRRLADLQAAVDSPMAHRRRRLADGNGDSKADGKGNKHKWFSTDGEGFR